MICHNCRKEGKKSTVVATRYNPMNTVIGKWDEEGNKIHGEQIPNIEYKCSRGHSWMILGHNDTVGTMIIDTNMEFIPPKVK